MIPSLEWSIMKNCHFPCMEEPLRHCILIKTINLNIEWVPKPYSTAIVQWQRSEFCMSCFCNIGISRLLSKRTGSVKGGEGGGYITQLLGAIPTNHFFVTRRFCRGECKEHVNPLLSLHLSPHDTNSLFFIL